MPRKPNQELNTLLQQIMENQVYTGEAIKAITQEQAETRKTVYILQKVFDVIGGKERATGPGYISHFTREKRGKSKYLTGFLRYLVDASTHFVLGEKYKEFYNWKDQMDKLYPASEDITSTELLLLLSRYKDEPGVLERELKYKFVTRFGQHFADQGMQTEFGDDGLIKDLNKISGGIVSGFIKTYGEDLKRIGKEKQAKLQAKAKAREEGKVWGWRETYNKVVGFLFKPLIKPYDLAKL